MNILHSVLLAAVFAGAECEPIPVSVPPFGCKLGSATASVPAVEGATYAWSIEGGVLTGGAGTNRIALTLGNGETVKVSVHVTTATCTREGTGIISLRPPLAIEKLEVPAEVEADKPVTITWLAEHGHGMSERAGQRPHGSARLLHGAARDGRRRRDRDRRHVRGHGRPGHR